MQCFRLSYSPTPLSSQVSTTLVAITDKDMLDKNIQSAFTLLTDKERELQKEVERRFFEPLKQRHWEGMEVTDYWRMMKKKNLAQPS